MVTCVLSVCILVRNWYVSRFLPTEIPLKTSVFSQVKPMENHHLITTFHGEIPQIPWNHHFPKFQSHDITMFPTKNGLSSWLGVTSSHWNCETTFSYSWNHHSTTIMGQLQYFTDLNWRQKRGWFPYKNQWFPVRRPVRSLDFSQMNSLHIKEKNLVFLWLKSPFNRHFS